MKLLVGLLIVIVVVIVMILVLDGVIIGVAAWEKGKKSAPVSFLLKEKNRLALQRSTECAGFSSAHVLRSFGVEAEGNDMYARMPGKLKNGAVLPGKLKKVLRGYGFKVRFVRGNVDSLKSELAKGNRVIAFVKTRLDKRWLHYVPIVGYNEEEIFIAESLGYLTNCREEHFNRRLSTEEFLKYWNTSAWYMPFYKNTYLVVER